MSRSGIRGYSSKFSSVDFFHAAMFFGIVLPQLASAAYDQSVRVQTNNGIMWVNLNDSNAKKALLIVILIALAINLSALLIENLFVRNNSFASFRFISALTIPYIFLNYILSPQGWVLHQVIEATVFWLYLLMGSFQTISPKLISILRNIILIAIGITLFYCLLMPNRGTFSCRPDKCGIFGTLWSGFFPHENALGFFFVIVISMSFIFDYGFKKISVQFISLVIILASGSRMAILALLVFLLTRYLSNSFLAIVPFLLYVAGVGLFVFLNNQNSLTGRGTIWMKIKSQLTFNSAWVYGQGINSFQTGKSKSIFGFALYDEQGTIASIFNRYGIIGALLFGAFLFSFYLSRHRIPKIGLSMLVVICFGMISESFSVPSVSNFYSFIYIFALCLPADQTSDGKFVSIK